jgi:hypothetical protein
LQAVQVTLPPQSSTVDPAPLQTVQEAIPDPKQAVQGDFP